MALTEDAVRTRRKTETRRLGWRFLQPGTELDLCRKVMGRKAGDPLVRIARVHVVSVGRERLDAITDAAVYREGFTDLDYLRDPGDGTFPLTPREWFVRFYTSAMGCTPDTQVTVIRWRYLFDHDRFVDAPPGPDGEPRWVCVGCGPAVTDRARHDAAHHHPGGVLAGLVSSS